MKVQIINKSSNPLPTYKHIGDAGMDVRANIDYDILLQPKQRVIIDTGLYFNLPDNVEIQVRPRSGLAARNGITVLNSPGTLDPPYNGMLKIIVLNTSNESFQIQHGDRIAQIVFNKFETVTKFNVVDKFETTTSRGEGGFGSTGIK